MFRRIGLFGRRYNHNDTLLRILNEGIQKNSKKGGMAASRPLVDAEQVTRRKIGLPPRTGPLVGRTVLVNNPQYLPQAIRRINTLNQINKLPQTVRLQRFAERPGKARLRIRIERKKREFNAGIRRLFDLVNEARRKGY